MSFTGFGMSIYIPEDASVDEENDAFETTMEYADKLEKVINAHRTDFDKGGSELRWRVSIDV